MKKTFTFYSVMVFLCFGITISSFAQDDNEAKKLTKENFRSEADNISYWKAAASQGIVPYNPPVPVKPGEYNESRSGSGPIETSTTDVIVWDESGVTQSENSIAVDPNDPDYALNSNNSEQSGSIYGANYIQSSDAGLNWSGTKYGAGESNKGDPAAAIDADGRQYVGYIDINRGQGVSYSDNGTTWYTANIDGPYSYPDLMDKNHLTVDPRSSGTYSGYVYSAWTHIESGDPNDAEIMFSRSTTSGASWGTPYSISDAISAGSHNQGVNIQTGPSGQVYAVWAVYDSWYPSSTNENAIGFARSLNGGASFYTAQRIHNNILGIRPSPYSPTSNPTGKLMRVNSFPTMAVDISGGPYNGYIYVAWSNIGVPGTNTGSNVSVYCMRSTNGGVSWGTPVKVNQGTSSNDYASFFPWLSCDPETGKVFCVFYDDHELGSTSTSCETWMAYSEDGGASWDDFQVSDVSFTPAAIPGLASGYMGDYLGIAARDNHVYPCWTDNRSGTAQTYVNPIEFTDACIANGGCDEYISNVTFGTINNSSFCEGYSNYTAFSNNVALNSPENLTVSIGNYFSGDDVTVWVDWNGDDDFYDANEEIGYATGAGPHIFSVDPPTGTALGSYTVRVRLSYSGSPPSDPCGTTTYGEVEDYTINVTEALPNYWTGAFNYYWHNDANWSLGHIPTPDEPVFITTSGYNPPTVDFYDEECLELTIQSGAGLNIRDQTLVVNEDVMINGELAHLEDNSYLNVYGNVFWYSGSTWDVQAYSSFINVLGNWNFESGSNVNPTLGFVDFEGTTSNWIRCYSSTSSFNNFRVYKSGGAAARLSNLCTQDLVVNNLTFITTGGVFNSLSNQDIIMRGAFNYYGTFDFTANSNTGTTIFDGSTQSINDWSSGSGIFNNIVFSSSTGTTSEDNVTVLNDVTIEEGYFNPQSHTVYVGGNWTNTGSGSLTPGTSNVIFESTSGSGQYVYGTCEFYDVQHVNTGEVMHFMGPTTIQNDLNLEYFCWSNNTFAVNGTLNVDNTSSKYTANSGSTATIAMVDQGGQVVCNGGNITINDLVETKIEGYWRSLYAGGVMNISNGGGNVDIGGDIYITDGTINIAGNFCYIPYQNDATLTMSGGIIDINSTFGLRIDDSPYALNDNITGGIIRTNGYLHNERADFTPTAGVMEMYGSSDVLTSQSNGGTFYNLNIDKEATKGGPTVNFATIEDDRGEKMSSGSKANTVSLSSGYTVTNDLTITSGSLTLSGYELTVANLTNVYGTLNMTNVADILNAGTGPYDNITFYSGSTGNLSAGNINVYGWIAPQLGCTFTGTPSHTVNIVGSNSTGGIHNDEPTAVYGNVMINKTLNNAYIASDSDEDIVVTGNFTVMPGNVFEMQNETMIVNGFATDDATSEIYVYDAKKAAAASKPGGGGSGSGTKAAYLELDNDFTLTGLLDVGDGSVLLHGDFHIASSGTLTINGGSVIADQSFAKGSGPGDETKAWQNLDGTINLSDGLFEISNNSMRFSSTSVNNVSGGIIRCGYTFYVINAGVFQPTGGVVEFVGSTASPYINCSAGNYFNDLTIDRGAILYLGSDIQVNNDILITAGPLNTTFGGGAQYDLYIGGNWTNNGGDAAFDEVLGTVTFNGSLDADIMNSETFYNLTVNKTSGSWYDLEFLDNNTLNVINDFTAIEGTLEMNNNTTLNIGNDMYLQLDGGLNVFLDVGLAVNIGGNWTNDNPDWDTFRGYSPGTEILTFLGGADQTLTTNASMEQVGYLVIDKPGGEFRPNDNVNVMYDLDILTGGWHDGVSSLTHYFEGDFYVTAGVTAYWNSLTGNTVVFKGTADQTVFNPIGFHYFHDIVVDKTAWPAKESIPEGAEPMQTGNKSGSGSKALTVTINSSIDMEFGDGLIVDEGILDLNGNNLQTMGDVVVNDGGTLIVDEGATLKIDDGESLNVYSGGTLEVTGAPGNLASFMHRNSGYYDFNILSGGTISANYGSFEHMTVNGVFVYNGGIVDPVNSFNNCTFQNGFPGYAALLLIDNADNVTVNNAHFPDAASTDFNVAKTLNQGFITMVNATGAFAGEDYEYDPYILIDWLNDAYTVYSNVTYFNASSTPLSNVTVNLMDGPTIIATDVSDINGDLIFPDIAPGNYHLESSTTKTWGGLSMNDVQFARQNVVNQPPGNALSGLALLAGDVDGSGLPINMSDVQFMRQKVLSQPPGITETWLFEQPTFTVSGSLGIQYFQGICNGDTDQSYVPPIAK